MHTRLQRRDQKFHENQVETRDKALEESELHFMRLFSNKFKFLDVKYRIRRARGKCRLAAEQVFSPSIMQPR